MTVKKSKVAEPSEIFARQFLLLVLRFVFFSNVSVFFFFFFFFIALAVKSTKKSDLRSSAMKRTAHFSCLGKKK